MPRGPQLLLSTEFVVPHWGGGGLDSSTGVYSSAGRFADSSRRALGPSSNDWGAFCGHGEGRTSYLRSFRHPIERDSLLGEPGLDHGLQSPRVIK